MRISSVINTVENGLIAAVKGTGKQARRIGHAFSVELAANRLADGENERRRLEQRPMVEAFEVQARAEALVAKRDTKELVSQLLAMRKDLAFAVKHGYSAQYISDKAVEIESLARLARSQALIEGVNAG